MARLLPVVAVLAAGLGSVLAQSPVAESYDYIVVGGGTSGLVLARRLSDNPDITVLVIEAGPLDDHEDFIDIPGLAMGAIGTKYDWNLTYQASEHVGGRRIGIPQGHVVGGGSLLNAMLWNRGTKRDYANWEALGAEGWGWDGLLDSFKMSEIYGEPTDEISEQHAIPIDWDVHDPDAEHGVNGIYASFSPYFSPSVHYFINASTELGVPLVGDAQSGEAYGVMYIPHSQDPEEVTRCSSRVGYYDPVFDRENISWLFGHKALRLILDGDVATGVEFSECEDCDTFTVEVTKDVVIASGAIGTPAFLQRSGVGPATTLEEAGVEQLVDNPHVGVGLSDHYMFAVAYSLPGLPTIPRGDAAALYEEEKTGPLSTVGGDILFFLSTEQYTDKVTEIQEMAAAQDPMDYVDPDWSDEYKLGYAKQHALLTSHIGAANGTTFELLPNDNAVVLVLLQPLSRGSVKIASSDAWEDPIIDSGFLRNPVDVALLVEAYRWIRKLYDTEAMAELSPAPLSPGINIETDAQIEDHIRRTGTTIFHPVGSCSMGPLEEGGCVDPASLKVYGLQNVRVVDSSIMPMIVGGHTQATVYGVAEKAAAIMWESMMADEDEVIEEED